jgi:hypothetical protein
VESSPEVSGLIDENQAQLRLLDLYLSGEFPREMLTERKARLEVTIASLEREQAGLVSHLKEQTLSEEHIQTLMSFAATVSENLQAMSDDFAVRRRLMVELDVQATLAVEDGQKVVYANCVLGQEVLSIASKETCANIDKTPRLVYPSFSAIDRSSMGTVSLLCCLGFAEPVAQWNRP